MPFFEVKNASFSPSVSHIPIFWLIMPRNFFGPVHNYMRLLIGAHLSNFLVKSIIPVTGSIVKRGDRKGDARGGIGSWDEREHNQKHLLSRLPGMIGF